MTEPFRQYRTRLFLPIKGKQDISKSSVSRWISDTVKLAYRKLTNKDFPFLKIKAHEVRALSSSWAFFSKVLLNEILKAAVWNQSSTCRPRWLSWMRCLTGDQEVVGSTPLRGRQHSFVEIDHEIFSTIILSLPLIQEGQLSVSGKRMCTILVNRLED